MTLYLRQSTSIDIRMGPFVDATTAVDPETGITLGAADQAEVLKANGAATVTMAGTFAAVTGADGWYDYTAATGDVDTTGEVVFVVQDASVCLPVYVRATVIDALTYDALYADTPTAFDANGRVDVGEWLGTAVTGTTAGRPDVNMEAIADDQFAPGRLGRWMSEGTNRTSDSGTTTTLVDAALTEADDRWNGGLLIFTSGTNNGYTAVITDYDLASTTITFTPATPNAVTTEQYTIIPGLGFSTLEAIQRDAQSATDLKDFADAGYDPATNVVASNVAEWLGTAVATPTVAGVPNTSTEYFNGSAAGVGILKNWLGKGTAFGASDSGTTTTFVDTALTQSDDYWNGSLLVFLNGTNNGYTATVIDFDSGTDTITFAPAVPNAVTTENYTLVPGLGHANVQAIQGDAQSTTDLKDFADAGYDPATNKVQGVVLVDTTTANSDMRGTDSAALASVATEARLSELDEATAGKMANQVDIIQTDTTTDIPADIAALNDVAATDIVTGGAIGTTAGAVDNVTLVDTTTTNTDMVTDTSSDVTAVKAKTDQLTFTKANELDANTQSINGAEVTGDGNATPWNGA